MAKKRAQWKGGKGDPRKRVKGDALNESVSEVGRGPRKTVKITRPLQMEHTLEETALVLMYHQQAIVDLLIEKKVITQEEFERQVDLEISRSMKK